ncbi:SIMPL domain-containing protein [Streptomyces sp. NPDC047022]|uniref:SIMPL domain-containing protein n=1 Tax=Streptomyces sp. NPDC047022 TaxID=3155737 RepID=UPI00340BD6FF
MFRTESAKVRPKRGRAMYSSINPVATVRCYRFHPRTAEITEPWGLSVLGAGNVSAESRPAQARLAVDLLAPTPKEAFEQAGAAVVRPRTVLREHGVPDSEISGSRLALKSDFKGYDAERTFLGYRCEATYIVQTEDLDRLGLLIEDAVRAGANRVDEVSFDVLDKPALRDEARRRAVRAARRKAEVYADACGVRLGLSYTFRTSTRSRSGCAVMGLASEGTPNPPVTRPTACRACFRMPGRDRAYRIP